MTLSFKNISYSYGDTEVLHQLSFAAKAGEITCLLGPSGGGKSTLLRLAAGMEHVQTGSVEINGEVIASESVHLAPEKRPVGLMFQENALFPHMTIAQNVGYGIVHLPKIEAKARVESLLAMVGLSEMADRYPHALSGGQQQRIALIRSLAPQPSVLLMDEPYASIDITLRRSLREAARQTLKQSGTATVMVTHDPAEAMEMADTIAVLDAGHIVQMGAPKELYEQPINASVAALFGDAQCIQGRLEGDYFSTCFGPIDISSREFLPQGAKVGADYELVARPSGLIVEPSDGASLKVIDLRFVGGEWIAFLLPADAELGAMPLRVTGLDEIKVGDNVRVRASQHGFFTFLKH